MKCTKFFAVDNVVHCTTSAVAPFLAKESCIFAMACPILEVSIPLGAHRPLLSVVVLDFVKKTQSVHVLFSV